jgi:hypothetical protein
LLPVFISCTPSVQHGMTPFKGNSVIHCACRAAEFLPSGKVLSVVHSPLSVAAGPSCPAVSSVSGTNCTLAHCACLLYGVAAMAASDWAQLREAVRVEACNKHQAHKVLFWFD